MRVVFALLALCALVSAQEVRSGWWRGKPVVYKVVDGLAIAEGDLILGPAAEIPAEVPDLDKSIARESTTINSDRYLWPDGVVPYVIDPALPNPDRVRQAIEHWNSRTPIRLVAQTGERTYVRFVKKPGGCSSYVGMIGREQTINLDDDCEAGAVIHEIGHAVGLYHEQSRQDRAFYVRLVPENVDKRELSEFRQALTDGRDAGAYDYGSIMHYDALAFSRNGEPVLQTIPAGIPISQRTELSAGDIDSVMRLYGRAIQGTTIATFPAGLEVEVDGERFRTPRTFQWTPGSTHTLNVPGPQSIGSSFRYVFGRWSDDGAQSHTITASDATTVYTANFIEQYRLPLTVNPAGAGQLTVTPAPDDGWLPTRVEIEVRAAPNGNYRFGGWSGFGAFGSHGISPNPLRFSIRSPGTEYRANFTQAPLTMITSEPAGLRVTVDGETITTPRNYTWSAGSTHTIGVPDAVQKTGNDTARHTFTGWSDDGASSHRVTAGADATYVARFRSEYLVSVEPSTGGSVELSPASSDGFYEAGSSVTVNAWPRDGYKLSGWTGDGAASVLVDGQKALGATFGAPRTLLPTSIVNAASYLSQGAIAPQSILSIFVPDIGATGDVRVLFDDQPGRVVALAPDQINVAAPASIAGRSAVSVRVLGQGWNTNARLMPVVASDPAIFTFGATGGGQAAALNADNSVNSASNPVDRGSVVVLWATGAATAPVTVRIAGRDARVLYAGQAPGMVEGVQQINAEIPLDCPSGQVPVVVRSGSAASIANVSVAVR